MPSRYGGGGGNPVWETAWLGDLPVAVTVPQTRGQFHIAPDHLGAPHQIAAVRGAVEWQWNHDPFGNGDPLGRFAYELRFPGQYFDHPTKLHYNYFRDYDPRLGRYIESDPIGLAGGINTYAMCGIIRCNLRIQEVLRQPILRVHQALTMAPVALLMSARQINAHFGLRESCCCS
jgi:RHS repeat-associated protein